MACIVSNCSVFTSIPVNLFMSFSPLLIISFGGHFIFNFLLLKFIKVRKGVEKTVGILWSLMIFWVFWECLSDHFLFCASKASSLLWVVAWSTFTFPKSILVGLYCLLPISLFCFDYVKSTMSCFFLYPRFFFMWSGLCPFYPWEGGGTISWTIQWAFTPHGSWDWPVAIDALE